MIVQTTHCGRDKHVTYSAAYTLDYPVSTKIGLNSLQAAVLNFTTHP